MPVLYTRRAPPVKVAGPAPGKGPLAPAGPGEAGAGRVGRPAGALDAGPAARRRFLRAGVLPPRREGDSKCPV
jgi:hypothetical protein